MMKNTTILILLMLPFGLLMSCSDSTTGTDPDPEESNETEEPAVTTGQLEVTVSTSGENIDEDGYELSVDGESKTADVDDTVTFTELEEGNYQLELEGMADNCSVEGDNPLDINITADETNSIEMEVICQSKAQGIIVFTQRIDQSTVHIFTMNADGSDQQPVGEGVVGSYPSISPDGSKIAYKANQGIWVSDIDGSNAKQLTTPDEFYSDNFPSWSPDGSQIVYESDAEKNYNNSEIYIMDIDGSNKTRLTEHEAEDERPSWSPDGETIIFNSDRDEDGSSELYTINVNSGEVSILLEPTDENGINLNDPIWSPDGSQIAYQGYTNLGHSRIFVADSDGENPQFITSTDVAALQPAWSPNGKYIAFVNLSDGNKTNAIWTISMDGEKETKLTDDQETVSAFPSWGPIIE